jgi:lipoprotein-anchoring transpeptidase ErfK/SrfK
VHRRLTSFPAALLALALLVTGCSDGGTAEPVAVEAPASASASPSAEDPVDAAPVPSLSASPSASPRSSASPAALAAPSYDVKAVQRQLTELNYYGGAIDGEAGPRLRSAVMAFQKVQGIGADGIVGKGTLAALAAPKAPSLRASHPANRVEVDLTRQVLYVVKGGAVQRILPVSSGNGATYRQKNGSKARALTPTGWYKIERRIVGERKADLGILYDPQYFYRGWAIHGSNSVPAGPASHGCVRVTRPDAKWLLGAISNGMSVYLYGGTHTFTAGSATGDTAGSESPSPAPSSPAPAPAPSSPAPSATSKPPSPTPTATQPSSSPSPSPSPSSSGSPSPSASASSLP